MDNFTLQQLAMCDGFNNDGSKHHQVSRGKQNSLVVVVRSVSKAVG